MKKLSLILLGLIGGAWGAEEFIISYSAKVENDILSGEQYKVSKVLNKRGVEGIGRGEYKIFKTCQIVPVELIGEGDIEVLDWFLKRYKSEVLDCLYESGVKIYDEVIAKNSQAQTKTIFKIPPTRVIVGIKNGVIDLQVLEKTLKK